MAVIAPSVSVNMSGHNNIQNQLTRSLERILEDAYLSGELKLSGRKLKDFPKAVKFNLSDTVIADLSKNRFSEVPDELTSYVYLERLLLGQNVIRNVPEAVGALQSLTYLDLSWNQLTEVPREVCQLPLEVLLLANNRLISLPKELGRMGSLAELDAANNRIAQLPMTIGDMPNLKALNLRNNQLGLLPLQITYLRLEFLDVSCNCISSLPLELRMMASLVTLRLDHNPLVSPPTTVCMKGRVHIFKYLENLANKDLLPHKRNDDTRRSAKHTSSFMGIAGCGPNPQAVAANATIDCLRHRTRHAVDSGYSTSDGGDKRWSNDGLPDEGGGGSSAAGLPVSLANLSAISCGSGRSTPSTPSTLSPGSANLSRAQSLSSDGRLTPQNTALGAGPRISPDGTLLNGDDKGKIGHQQTYRQYKEALRQQRQQDVYRPRAEQPSPSDIEASGQTLNQSPVHIPKHSQSTPHSPVANGHHTSLLPSSVYTRNVSSNPSLSSSGSLTPNSSQTIPNSPLLHSTPRRFQSNIPQTVNYQNGNLNANPDLQNVNQYSKTDDNSQNKRPVQKVVPSRNTSKQFVSPNALSNAIGGALTNGNLDYQNRLQGTNGGSPKLSNMVQGTSNSPQDGVYIKPLSPTKSPTGTLLHGSVPPNVRSTNIPSRKDVVNGEQTNGTNGPKLLTTTVSYLKGSGPKPASNTGRLNWNKDAPLDKLSFTMKREFDKQKEESELLQQLRVIIESKLKMSLPEDLAPVLADGVVLCHLANHVRPRSVASVHVPSPAQPKLTMARCRRNVDNFLEACRKIGVEEDDLCHADDILQHHPDQREEAQHGVWPRALLTTVTRLATHATDTHYSPPPRTALSHYDTNANDRVYDSAFFEERDELLTNETFQYDGDRDHYQISVNYFQSKQVFRNRYNEDRLVSNFNTCVNAETNVDNLTIDEVDEFDLNVQNNNSEKHYMNSPDYEVGNDFVYHNPEMKLIGTTNGRHEYDQPNVHYVVPLIASVNPNYVDSVKLAFDEVDSGYVRRRVEVYNRQNMNLDIKDNLNEMQSRELQSLQAKREHDRIVTWLCLGMFFLTAILLFIFPL